MTNDTRTEKNLNRIQKKLQILTPIIQDAHKSWFDLFKTLTTISISLHGGAILVLVNNSYDYVFYDAEKFLWGLGICLIASLAILVFDNFSIVDYRKKIFSKNMKIYEIVVYIGKRKSYMQSFLYFVFFINTLLFIYGIYNVFNILKYQVFCI